MRSTGRRPSFCGWAGSARSAVPASFSCSPWQAGDQEGEDGAGGLGLGVAAGVYSIHRVPFGDSLALRLEAGMQPFGEWKERAPAPGDPDAPEYGLYLFPEVVLAASPTTSYQLRALISPVDLSGFLQLGARWNIYQGLTLLGFASVMAGEADDVFVWDRDGSLSLTLGAEYIY